MTRLRKFAWNTRHVLVCAAVIGSAAVTLVAAPVASAETDYSCEACPGTSGPNEWIDYVGGTNYDFKRDEVVIWKYNADGSYGKVWDGFAEIGHIEHCLGYEHRVKGHGTTYAVANPETEIAEPEHMSGKEWLWNNGEGPC